MKNRAIGCRAHLDVGLLFDSLIVGPRLFEGQDITKAIFALLSNSHGNAAERQHPDAFETRLNFLYHEHARIVMEESF